MTELSRFVALDRIGAVPLEQAVEARPEELEPLAGRLQIPAVHRLRCLFRLRRIGDAVIEAEGELEAEAVQVCVVSLDEFAQPVVEGFTVQFVPAGTEAPDDDLESPDQIPYTRTSRASSRGWTRRRARMDHLRAWHRCSANNSSALAAAVRLW